MKIKKNPETQQTTQAFQKIALSSVGSLTP
jgi:hypothetical protein